MSRRRLVVTIVLTLFVVGLVVGALTYVREHDPASASAAGSSVEDPPSSSEVSLFMAQDYYSGVTVTVQYKPEHPVFITGTSMTYNNQTSEGALYAEWGPDRDAPPDSLMVSPPHSVLLYLDFLPDCSVEFNRDELTVTVEVDHQQQHVLNVPNGGGEYGDETIDAAVEDWCTSGIAIEVRNQHSDADLRYVRSKYLVTLPGGPDASLNVVTPGWHGDIENISPGETKTLVVESQDGCGHEPVRVEINYSDGTTENKSIGDPGSDVCE